MKRRHFGRAILLAAGLAITAFPVHRSSAAEGHCPDNSHPAYESGNVVHCRCNDGYENVGGSCAPAHRAVPDLAKDPNAARLSAAQLQLVDGRIANLQKAIALLGDANPEWAAERERVLEDMHEDAVGLSWEGVNLMSIGLTELAKKVAQARMSGAEADVLVKALEEPLAALPAEEARLNRVMATTQDPALTKAILEYTAALHRLRDAQYSSDVVNMVARARDAAEALRSEFEMIKLKPPPSGVVADGVYVSSAFLGRVAIIFVAGTEGPEAVGAAIGSAGASVLVGGREVVNLWEERGRLAALDQNASDRNRMKHVLYGRLADLQQQHDRLVWAVQHAGPADGAR